MPVVACGAPNAPAKDEAMTANGGLAPGGDWRSAPIYSVAEVAALTGVHALTVRRWLYGEPAPSGAAGQLLVSFLSLVEILVTKGVPAERRPAGARPPSVRFRGCPLGNCVPVRVRPPPNAWRTDTRRIREGKPGGRKPADAGAPRRARLRAVDSSRAGRRDRRSHRVRARRTGGALVPVRQGDAHRARPEVRRREAHD